MGTMSARLLGDRNELGGQDKAARRVSPANQRLAADDALLDHADQRLIVKFELVSRKRRAQVVFQRNAGSQKGVHFRFKEPVHGLSVGLGAVERDIGVLQNLVGVHAVVRRDGDADANADRKVVPVDAIGRAQDFDHPLRQRRRALGTIDLALDDREFIAAQTCDEVRLTNGFARTGSRPLGAIDRRWGGRTCR